MKLSGFTLFKVPKGWQLSVREEGENGWQVHVGFSKDKAQRILDVIGDLDLVPARPPDAAPVRGRLDLRPAPKSLTRVRL